MEVPMDHGNRRLLAASPPATAKSPSENGIAPAHNMIVGFVAGILSVMVVALLYCLFRRKVIPFFKQGRTVKGKEKKGLEYDKISLRCFNLEELEKATNNFSQDWLLGSGAFGNVYWGNFGIEGSLAIKRPHFESFLTAEEFRNEVRLLSKVKHRNLVDLVGYCEEHEGDGAKMLVYEYVPNGSLLEYMMGKRENTLTWRQRVKIAIGAARGIAYLHEGVKPSIIHRDIKPSNILLGEGFEAKVSDFGLVKSGPIGDQSHVSSQIKGTPGYLDPAYCSSFHLTIFSDVYSFGVILLQLVSARPAVDTTENQNNHHIIDWARPSLEKGSIEEILDLNLLCEPCNMEVMLKMGQLAMKCVAKVPKHRPTMTQVCQELEATLSSADNSYIDRRPWRGFRRSFGSSQHSAESSEHPKSMENYDNSQSYVSIDGVGFQKFVIEIDSVSLQSTMLKCLKNNSNTGVDNIDKNSLRRIQEDEHIENLK